MTMKVVDAVKRLQEHILEVGLARGVIASSAPRMLTLASPTGEEAEPSNIFAATITEPEIAEVSRDLFASGHYTLSVQESYKAIDKFVSEKTKITSESGTTLMELVFSIKGPTLYWSDRSTRSEEDEHAGYFRLFAGAMLGIRNPATHEFNWIEDPKTALELIVFAQHLLRKAKVAQIDEKVAASKRARSSAA